MAFKAFGQPSSTDTWSDSLGRRRRGENLRSRDGDLSHSDPLGDFGKLLLRSLELRTLEIDVGYRVEWNEVNVCVRNFEADDGHPDALTWDGSFDLTGHVAGK